MKKELRIYPALFMLALALLMIQCKSKVPQLGKDPLKDVIAAMTLEEKAYFVTGTGMVFPGLTLPGSDSLATPGAPVVGESQKIVPGCAGTTYEIPRLGIPSIVLADGPAGLRISPKREGDSASYYCTAYPVGTLLASSWDTALIASVGRSMGNEVKEYNADIILGPGMNIHRNPLCGRNFEYYSEDPYLTGKMAASIVNGIESQGVGTSIKHFAANNAETNRMALNTIVSERALREIYLEGFRIAVEESQPWTVMSSYNLINDTMASESSALLTKVLREDWNFKGCVMTDWFGGRDPIAQMKAGNDLLMPGTPQQAKMIIEAVKAGKLDVAVLDRNIERILNLVLQSPKFKKTAYSNKPDLKAHAEVTRQAGSEGMVLLKNTNAALPLASAVKNIAAFGNTSYEIITGGTGSGDVNEAYSVSLIEGLKGAGYVPDEELQGIYNKYITESKAKRGPSMPFAPPVPIAEMQINSALAAKFASVADIALITIGRNSGEMADRKEEADFNLTTAEKNMIKAVTSSFHAKGKKVVVILNIAGVIETASWRDIPDAILIAWQAGQETGNSIADVISGKVNPSGKLPSTFPMKYSDVPSAKNFPGVVLEQANQALDTGMAAFMRPKPSKVIYEEGIYVGYRYYETFSVKPAYEFGYGLSYTTFEYSNIKMNSETMTDAIIITVDIKNTGKVAGKEIAQLYIHAPAAKLDKPALELKGFAKSKLLAPGESQTVSFTLTPRSLSSFDPATSSWIAEAGTYTVKIGASSKNLLLDIPLIFNENVTVKKENAVLVPSETINEIKASK